MSLPAPLLKGAKCYVAGPMTGMPDWNRPAFEKAARAWAAAGWETRTPIEMDDKEYGGPERASRTIPYPILLLRDLDRIVECQAVALLPGWENSRGARLEVHWAAVCQIPVYDAITGQAVWWKESLTPDRKVVHAAAPVHASVNSGEERVVSPTGGAKGQKMERYDLIPPEPLRLLAEHYGRGAKKYGDDNWTKGYDWSLNFAAMQRHAWAFWGGEDNDPETGSPHMVAVAWHAFTLLAFASMHPEFDNRRKS